MGAFGVNAEDCLERLARSPYGLTRDVAADGDKAVLANGAALQVLDLTAPEEELVAGELFFDASITGVAISGDRGYATTRFDLVVIDLTDPALPTRTGELGGFNSDAFIRVSGELVFRQGYETLTIVDVSNPSIPVVASQLIGSQFNDLRVVGPHLFAAADAGGLIVIDVSDSTNPQQIGSLSLGGNWEARHLDVAGGLAYIRGYDTSSYEAKLFIVDVGDPAHPSLSWDFDLVNRGGEIEVEGGHAFIASGGLQVYDIGDPSSIQWVGALELPCNSGRSLSTAVDRALMTCEHSGLSVIDTTLPSAPTEIGSVAVPGELRNGDHDHGILALASIWGGFHLIGVADPINPVDHGMHFLGLDVVDVVVDGDYLHTVGYGNHGYDLVDITDPLKPVVLGTVAGFGGELVEVVGDRVFIADINGSLQIIDVSNPFSPTVLGSLSFPGAIWDFMAVSGDLVALRNQGSIDQALIIDVSNPSLPEVVSVIDAPYSGGVAFFGRYLLLGDAVLRIFDLHDPADPRELPPFSPFGVPIYLGSVEVSGTVAYLEMMPVYLDHQIAAVDMGDPRSPVTLASTSQTDRGSGFAFAEDHVFAITLRTGFDVLAHCHGPIFADGFESGDTSAWASAAP